MRKLSVFILILATGAFGLAGIRELLVSGPTWGPVRASAIRGGDDSSCKKNNVPNSCANKYGNFAPFFLNTTNTCVGDTNCTLQGGGAVCNNNTSLSEVTTRSWKDYPLPAAKGGWTSGNKAVVCVTTTVCTSCTYVTVPNPNNPGFTMQQLQCQGTAGAATTETDYFPTNPGCPTS
jgi:hypothetical protein